MSEDATQSEQIAAVALLRVPEWDAPEEVDVRFLEDGALVFLPVDFDADPAELIDELLAEVGEVANDHDDERGVFFLPDCAEPDDAETYEAVIAAVGDAGKWISPDDLAEPAPDLSALLGGNTEGMMTHVLEAMGISDPKSFMHAMQSGDAEAMKLAQIQMQGKLEEMMRAAQEKPGEIATTKHDGDEGDGAKDPTKR